MQSESLLMLMGEEGFERVDLLSRQPRIPYTPDEQRLSVLVQREIDHLLDGRHNHLVLLKLYPQRAAGGPVLRDVWPGVHANEIRAEVATRMAADVLGFFGSLHGGITTQEAMDDLIVQGRTFSTAYPHIRLERYDIYDAITSEPLIGAWRARRTQNQLRETRRNRMLDLTLLTLEVAKSVFPLLR